MQILYCLRSHFYPEKEQEGELFSLWLEQDGWKYLKEIEMQVYNAISDACPLDVLYGVCVG